MQNYRTRPKRTDLNHAGGEWQQEAYELLKFYGWSFEEGEEEIINGSSELYSKEE